MNTEKKPVANEEIVHFRHQVPIQIRFNDVDRYGHVNNNSYFSYYDLGKEDYLHNVLKVDYEDMNIVPVIANIQADFILPIFYGDPIVVETRICRMGNKSFTLEQQAINEKLNMVVCRCSTVMVCFSLKDQQAVEIPASYREAISRHEGIQ
ncbi:protein containing Thioesterase superfamily domain protein [gut metagenome]|uniref:Protein containing Thioesterase superfamily domain protein n=1 Tax=gut metagenome TaxID=749906 RepID=J9DBM6_9ZZZZ